MGPICSWTPLRGPQQPTLLRGPRDLEPFPRQLRATSAQKAPTHPWRERAQEGPQHLLAAPASTLPHHLLPREELQGGSEGWREPADKPGSLPTMAQSTPPKPKDVLSEHCRAGFGGDGGQEGKKLSRGSPPVAQGEPAPPDRGACSLPAVPMTASPAPRRPGSACPLCAEPELDPHGQAEPQKQEGGSTVAGGSREQPCPPCPPSAPHTDSAPPLPWPRALPPRPISPHGSRATASPEPLSTVGPTGRGPALHTEWVQG